LVDRLQRRLAAILCADVFGYSRLMWEDEPQRIVKLQLVVIADSREVMIDHLVNWVIHLMNWVI